MPSTVCKAPLPSQRRIGSAVPPITGITRTSVDPLNERLSSSQFASLSDDALLSDNGVVMVEPRPQIVAVDDRLKEGRGRTALEKALGSLAGVVQGSPGHLAFVDAAVPPAPGSWQARFGRPDVPLAVNGTPEDLIGPFVLEKRRAGPVRSS